MNNMSKATRLWDAFSSALLSLGGFAFWLAGGVTLIDILGRHLLKASVPAAIELSVLCVALGVLASLPACFSQRAHIEVSIVADISGQRVRRLLSVIGRVFSLIFSAALAVIFVNFAARNLGGYRRFPDTGLDFFVAMSIVAGFFILATIGALRAFFALSKEIHHG